MTSVLHGNRLIQRSHNWISGFQERLKLFLFPSASDSWLAVLRIGLGFQLMLYCLSLRKDWIQLFGANGTGLINRELIEAVVKLDSSFLPTLGWLVTLGNKIGLSEQTVLWGTWASLLCASGFLLLGVLCRCSAVVAWFLYVCAVNSGNLLAYGVDNFTIIGLFYLMLAPFPDRYALDRKFWRSPIRDRRLHGFFRRVLQLHLSVIYFFGGLTKCLGAGWWTGENMWRALTHAPFNILPQHLIISWRAVLPILGIAILVLETGYPVFIWLKKTRLVWLIAIVCMHIAIGLTMGLYLFALIMIILNLAAFGPGLLRPEKTRTELAVAELEQANSLRP